MSPSPMSIEIPPPPPLISSPSHPIPTNTYALLLPHPALFHPPTLTLLRTFYSSFGSIRTWAPVRGLGRVIVVWEKDEDGGKAKLEGDRVEVEVVTEEGSNGIKECLKK
jgi:calcipressin-2